MDHSYLVFGLFLHSNLALPEITSVSRYAISPQIELRLGISPLSESNVPAEEEELSNVSSYFHQNGEPFLRIWRVNQGELLRIAYSDGTQFWIDRKYEKLWATWPATSSLEDTSTYLLGPVLGILLRLRGVTCLHASAVAFGDCSVAFVGWAGAGKSTTAAAFALQGYRILSDDIVALEEKEGDLYVLPAYPHLCLWPESVKALYGSPGALPRFVPDWEKRRLSLSEEARFENRALPLRAVYLLGERRQDSAPYVENVAPKDALISLVTESYANKLLDRELRTREFEVLGRLATKIPIRRVYAHEDPAKISDLCKLIRQDFAALEPAVSAQP